MSAVDDYLLHRAEQAVLGALLAGADPALAGVLRAQSFADPVHQAIYAAITRPSRNRTGRLGDWAARISSRTGRDAVGYIAELPGLCPEIAHLAVYAGMLRETRPGDQAAGADQPGQSPWQEHRAAAGPGQQLEGASQWLSAAGAGRHAASRTRNPRQQWQAPAEDLLDPATERLSRAIRAAIRSGRLREPRPSRAGQARGAAAAPARPGDANATASLRQDALQDAVLADLMRHPADGQELVQRVPPNVFSRGPRQELYRLIAWPIAQGKPVDWLITAWQARKQEASGHGGPGTAGDAATESLTAIAVRLGAMRPVRGTAGVIGRALLADYEVSTAFGPQWTRQRELNWAAAGTPAADGHQASNEPGASPWPATPAQRTAMPRAARQAPAPAVPRQPAAQRQAAWPAPGRGHGPQPGGRMRQGRGPVPQTMPPPPQWGNAGWQQGPVQRG